MVATFMFVSPSPWTVLEYRTALLNRVTSTCGLRRTGATEQSDRAVSPRELAR